MDFGQILKRAWALVVRHRYLWWLGILAGIVEGGTGGNSFRFAGELPWSSASPTPSPGASPLLSPTPATSAPASSDFDGPIARVLGESIGEKMDQQFQSALTWLTSHWQLAVFFALLFLILFLIAVYFGYAARAGLIHSVDGLEQHKKPSSFAKAIRTGYPFVWRLWGFDVLLAILAGLAVVIIALSVGAAIVALLALGNIIFIIPAVIVGIALLAGVIIASIYLTVFREIVGRRIVLETETIGQATQIVPDLLQSQRTNFLYAWLLTLVISFAYGLLFIPIFLIAGLLGFVGYFLYTSVGLGLTIFYGVVVGLLVVIGCTILGGLFTAYISTFWTLAYRATHYLHHRIHPKTKESHEKS